MVRDADKTIGGSIKFDSSRFTVADGFVDNVTRERVEEFVLDRTVEGSSSVRWVIANAGEEVESRFGNLKPVRPISKKYG